MNEAIDDEGMTPQQETKRSEQEKRSLLQGTIPLVKERIDRDVEREEKKALGFVIEKSDVEGGPATFVEDVLGVEGAHTPTEASMAINTKIYDTNKNELRDRLLDASGKGDPAQVDKLHAIGEGLDIGHAAALRNAKQSGTKVSLGSTPEYWLPPWVKNVPWVADLKAPEGKDEK